MAEQPGIAAGLGPGASGEDVTRVQEYLERYGYLGDMAGGMEAFGAAPFPIAEGDDYATLLGRPSQVSRGTFDSATAQAVRRFQEFAGIPVTGIVDQATAAKMSQPRCGNPDVAGMANFATSGRRWAMTNLRYAFQNLTPDLGGGDVSIGIEQALALWAAHTPLRFTPVSMTAGPEILLRFAAGDHGDGSAFDGPSGTLAHAFFPSVPPAPVTPLAGDTHFDEAETWTIQDPPAAGAVDLVTVAAHEFGHALGLGHSAVTAALMAPFYGGPHRFLDADDIAGITSLYGPLAIEQEMWANGADLRAEVDANVESIQRFGFFTRVVGKPNTTNWYHFAVPTPTIVKGGRLCLARAMLRLVTGGSAVVRDVHVYDGSARIAAHQGVNVSGDLPLAAFGIPHKPEVFWGAGISVGVTTGTGDAAERRMDFIGAGIDFLA